MANMEKLRAIGMRGGEERTLAYSDYLQEAHVWKLLQEDEVIKATITSKFIHEGLIQILREIMTYEGYHPESIIPPIAKLHLLKEYGYYHTLHKHKRSPEEKDYDVLGLDGKKFSYTGQLYRYEHARIHYYNNIATTESPYYLSLFIFYSVLAGIVYDMKLEYLMVYVLTPLIMFVAHIFAWINELSSESVYYGRYNSKIRMSLLVGFILFLVSEAMLFLGFFWTFFDRLFALPAHVPQVYTIEHINCTGAPLLGTVLLIASGYCANISFYQAHSFDLSRMMHRISIVFGMAFLAIQVYEYQELMSSISYNVFFSIFFVLTGFHGFHVIVGLLFLLSNDHIFTDNLECTSRGLTWPLTAAKGMIVDSFDLALTMSLLHGTGGCWFIRHLYRLDKIEAFGQRLERLNVLGALDGPALALETDPDMIDLSHIQKKIDEYMASKG